MSKFSFINLFFLFFLPTLLFSKELYYIQNHKKVLLEKIETQTRDSSIYYKTEDGRTLILKKPQLIVSFKTENALETKEYLQKFVIEERKLDAFTSILTTQTSEDLFNLLEYLNNDEDVRYAHPDFTQKLLRR